MPLSDFPVLFKADLISRTFQESNLNSSTFQACWNPVITFSLVVPVLSLNTASCSRVSLASMHLGRN